MKKNLIAFCMLIIAAACNSAEQETAATDSTTVSKHEHMGHGDTATAPDYSGLAFASRIDTICGMPIKAGVADTAMVDGKIYGFCAKECKDEFIKTMTARK